MTVIADSAELAAFCRRQAAADFLAIDTEFLRDTTYWPKLCLVQLGAAEGAVAVDTLANGMDLTPLGALLANQKVLKVFHSARQDMEIFFHLFGRLPEPIFDTQVAAMVCGFGESVSYDRLVSQIVGARLDKVSRFADWSHRPLTPRQLDYALADVIHLRPIYERLSRQLEKSGRAAWLSEEMTVLTTPATYALEPEEAWRRLKSRSNDRRFLAVLKALAAWREVEAQRRDVPRNRILREVRRKRGFVPVTLRENLNWEEVARIEVNAPGTTSSVVLEALAGAGATQCEPGNGLHMVRYKDAPVPGADEAAPA